MVVCVEGCCVRGCDMVCGECGWKDVGMVSTR